VTKTPIIALYLSAGVEKGKRPSNMEEGRGRARKVLKRKVKKHKAIPACQSINTKTKREEARERGGGGGGGEHLKTFGGGFCGLKEGARSKPNGSVVGKAECADVTRGKWKDPSRMGGPVRFPTGPSGGARRVSYWRRNEQGKKISTLRREGEVHEESGNHRIRSKGQRRKK